MRQILGEAAWAAPGLYRHTLTSGELKKLIGCTHDIILVSNGVTWEIRSKVLAENIHLVWLEPKI